jgi:hypothetical protein
MYQIATPNPPTRSAYYASILATVQTAVDKINALNQHPDQYTWDNVTRIYTQCRSDARTDMENDLDEYGGFFTNPNKLLPQLIGKYQMLADAVATTATLKDANGKDVVSPKTALTFLDTERGNIQDPCNCSGSEASTRQLEYLNVLSCYGITDRVNLTKWDAAMATLTQKQAPCLG